MITQIQKRNGDVVPFDSEKIRAAIEKANVAVGGEPMSPRMLKDLTNKVVSRLPDGSLPTVEQIQDIVEEELIRNILYLLHCR